MTNIITATIMQHVVNRINGHIARANMGMDMPYAVLPVDVADYTATVVSDTTATNGCRFVALNVTDGDMTDFAVWAVLCDDVWVSMCMMTPDGDVDTIIPGM